MRTEQSVSDFPVGVPLLAKNASSLWKPATPHPVAVITHSDVGASYVFSDQSARRKVPGLCIAAPSRTEMVSSQTVLRPDLSVLSPES